MHTPRSAICRQERLSAVTASLLLVFTGVQTDATRLSLDQAMAYALAGNQELRAARSDVEAARARAGEVSELDVNAAALELERLRQERAALNAATVSFPRGRARCGARGDTCRGRTLT